MSSVYNTVRLVGGCALAAWMTAGTARADEHGANQPSAQQEPSTASASVISATATVQKIDTDKRELTVKGPDGNPVIVGVPSDVPGLDKVKVGDQVSIAYYQSVALTLRKPGEPPTATTTKTTEQPGGGPLPGGTVGRQITATVKVVKIDRAKNQLTIQAPSGERDTITVRDAPNRAQLRKLVPGDELQVTYSEAIAASISKG